MKVVMYPDYRPDNPYQRLLSAALAKEGVEVSFPSGYKRGLHFTRQLRGVDFDVVHMHWPDIYLRGRGAIARRLFARKLCLDLRLACRGKGVVWTVHNIGRHDDQGDRVERDLHRWLAHFADRLLVHDESLIDVVHQRYEADRGKILTVPHGHYGEFYGAAPSAEAARRQLALPGSSRVFLFLGMLRAYKGLEALLEIWPSIHRDHPEALLLIVGGGNDDAYIARITERAKATPGVRLEPRFVEDQEIPVYYGAADVAVFPFRAITTSGSMILALSYGCPVIAPNVPSISGELGFLGPLLYPPGSEHGLEEALRAAMMPMPAGWAQKFSELREVYSWERAAKITAGAYRASITHA